jgi:hypothetical protein
LDTHFTINNNGSLRIFRRPSGTCQLCLYSEAPGFPSLCLAFPVTESETHSLTTYHPSIIMEGEHWEQVFVGWDRPLVRNSEGHCMIIPRTLEEEERNESIRRVIRQHFEENHQSIQVLDGESDGLQYCSKHQGINMDDITAPLDLGFLDQILLNCICPLCLFIHRVCQTLLAVQLQKAGTWTRCCLVPITFRKNYFFENGFRLGPAFQSEPFGRTIYLQFSEETYDFRQQYGDDFMIPIHRLAGDGQLPGPLEGRQICDQVDLELVRSWLYRCRTEHDLSCEGLSLHCTSTIGGNIRVLDVRCRRVITAPENCQFIALSYVWGPSEKQPFKSLKSNSLDPLGKPKDLEIPPGTELPATIEDAIQVTSELEIDYLWVDALCLIQDDPDYIASQIPRMGEIYTSAIMTIIAAGSKDSWSPLPGMRAGSRLVRKVAQQVGESRWANVLPRSRQAINTSLWNSRAWTFQEKIFSRRCLVFSDDQVYFTCSQEAWCEDTHAETLFTHRARPDLRPDLLIPPMSSNLLNKDDFFASYTRLVSSYTGKNLAIPGDVLNAFTGIMIRLEQVQATELMYGLPVTLLDRAILWSPTQPLSVRTSDAAQRARPTAENITSGIFPTWTWAGWIGPVNYETEILNESDVRSKIKWYKRQTRRASRLDKQLGRLGDESMASNGVLRFWTASAWFRILSAERMYEIIGIAKIGEDPANTLRRAIIADHAGKHAGELVLDTDVVSLPTDTAEFILICEVKSTKRHIWMDGHGGRSQDVIIHDSMGPSAKRRKVLLKEEKDWSYYKVMLIIRVKDYAYRVAVGTVDKGAWELQKPVSTFIQLA